MLEALGLPIPPDAIDDMARLEATLSQKDSSLSLDLQKLLSKGEVRALQTRVKTLLEAGHFPEPGPGRHYPWPLV